MFLNLKKIQMGLSIKVYAVNVKNKTVIIYNNYLCFISIQINSCSRAR